MCAKVNVILYEDEAIDVILRNNKRSDFLMPFFYGLGTKDMVLAISYIILVGLTVVYHWSAIEFIITIGAVTLAFFTGSMRKDKRIRDQEKHHG